MFKPFKGGSTITVQENELQTEVHLPPVGYGYHPDTRELIEVDVLQSSFTKADQVWQAPMRPAEWDVKRKREKARIEKGEEDFFDPDLEAYRQREWHRRLHGIWFVNNGKNIYLTGLNYFYLTHWYLPIGLPDFRWTDAEYFYFLQRAVEDPNCYGIIETTRRRQGKTARATCFMYEGLSRNKYWWGGIQSKTTDDAKKNVFMQGVVLPFKKLIDFFRPVYDTDKGATPTTELRFYKPNKRGKHQYEYDLRGELESTIDFRSSDPSSYDGFKVQRYVLDEAGKFKDQDVSELWNVVAPSLEAPDGSIAGKAIVTSTVEDMEKMGDGFLRLWQRSDQSRLNKNGRTASGLYRYFTPAYNALHFNKYGYPESERSREFYEAERESRKDDPRDLASYIRKYPFNWQEAFANDSEVCLYNPLKLKNRLEYLLVKRNVFEKGNLVWKDGERDSEVIWEKNPKGRWMMAIDPKDIEDKLNNVKRVGKKYFPNNKLLGILGADPYDMDAPVNGKGSMGAGAVYFKPQLSGGVHQQNFVCLYHARPPMARMYFEDMIKTAFFFGVPIIPEDNKRGLITYLEDRGYDGFIFRVDGKKGITATPKSHIMLAEATEAFIEERSEVIMYEKLIREWLAFDIKNTTKFDLAMATGWALVGAGELERRTKRIENRSLRLDSYFRTHKIS